MNADDFNKAWVCHNCGMHFIIRSDKENHIELSGHSQFAIFDLQTGQLLKLG